MKNSLRVKIYAMILPLIVMIVAFSAVFASLESRTALTGIMNHHMTYKAEQLRDYAYSEWDVLENLQLADKEEYRNAAVKSFLSYASSLLRTDTEQILIFDAQGRRVSRISLRESDVESGDENTDAPVTVPALTPGWFNGSLFGETRVGVVFAFEPFGWTVAMTELESRFFSQVRTIGQIHLLILAFSLILLLFFVSLVIGHITKPLERLAQTIGNITETGDLTNHATIEYQDEIGLLARRFNDMIDSIQVKNRELERIGHSEHEARETAVQREMETLLLLGRISDFRDERTEAHLVRIGALSALLGRLAGLDETEQDILKNSAPLHDMGNISVPESILQKPGKLTEDEFEVIKMHPGMGYNVLIKARSTYLIEGAQIALTHHEKWDGTGYPRGLRADEIPINGRIVSLVDVFDSLTSELLYKKAWSFEDARQYIVSMSAVHFDPLLVKHFTENFSLFCDICERPKGSQ